jgi:CRP-like cAMP-binding protein
MDYRPAVATHESNGLLAGLPPETLAAMAENLQQQTINQGQVLYEPGDKIDNAYFPQSGMISLLIATEAGNSVEAASIGREGGFGLRNGVGERRSFTRAVAQIGGKFSVLATKHLAHCSQHYTGFRDMVEGYAELRVAEAQQFAACNAAHDGSSRLARWLLQCADRTGSDVVPLTQEFLAQMLGIRRTTVTLMAQELQRLKLIKYSRGRISILDRAGLKARACECYHVTRHEKLALLTGLKN